MKKKKFVFICIFILLQLVVFLLLEVILRISNFGIMADPFVRLGDRYITNKYFVNKYYPKSKKKMQSLASDSFLVKKSIKTKRIFILGGSTAAGFPYFKNQSFGKILENAINQEIPEKVEVINLGFSAQNSFYIADAAKKIKKYKPDVIMIYAGHNEFYGNLPARNDMQFYRNKIYLFLKEFRIFQLLFNLTDVEQFGKDDTTLMDVRFNNQLIPDSTDLNQAVYRIFRKNLTEVIGRYRNSGTKIVLVEPVSNLIDMPPFKAESDKIGDQYKQYYLSKDKKIALNNPKYPLELFVTQYHKFYENQQIDLDELIKIKDGDQIPFRARSGVWEEVESLKSRKDVRVLMTYQDWLTRYQAGVFSNNVFIDHLHFNLSGQIVLAHYITENIFDILEINNPNTAEKILRYFTDREKVLEDIHFNPINEIHACGSIARLIEQSPYKQMVLPYKNDLIAQYEKYYQYNDINVEFSKITEMLYQSGNVELLRKHLMMIYSIEPNNPTGVYNLAQFYKNVMKDPGLYEKYNAQYDYLKKYKK